MLRSRLEPERLYFVWAGPTGFIFLLWFQATSCWTLWVTCLPPPAFSKWLSLFRADFFLKQWFSGELYHLLNCREYVAHLRLDVMCVDWLTGPNLSCIIKFNSSSSQNYSGTLNTTTNPWLQWLNLVLHISICPGNRGHFNGWMWTAPRWCDGFPAASQGFGLLLPSSLSAHLYFQACRPFPSFVICVPYKGHLRLLALLSVFCARTVKT